MHNQMVYFSVSYLFFFFPLIRLACRQHSVALVMSDFGSWAPVQACFFHVCMLSVTPWFLLMWVSVCQAPWLWLSESD